MKPPYPTFFDESNVPNKSTFLVPDVLRIKSHFPFHIHPLEMLVKAKLIAAVNTPFELTDVLFEEPL